MGGCVQFKKTGSFQLHFDCVLQPKNLQTGWHFIPHSNWTKTQAWMLGSTSVARKHFSRTARTEAMTVEGPVERSAWVAFGVRRNPGVFDFNIHQKKTHVLLVPACCRSVVTLPNLCLKIHCPREDIIIAWHQACLQVQEKKS